MALLGALLLLASSACDQRQSSVRQPQTGGDPGRGAQLIAERGCGGCHSVPGIANAHGLVGPPLDNIGERRIIAGMLPNTPPNLIAWLKTPQAIVPGNAMPNTEFNDHDAADVAAYLYTLR